MMKRTCLLIISLIVFAGLTSRALAHDGEWGSEESPIDVNWIGDIVSLDLDHEDAEPYKGWATIQVRNKCGEDWGDYHFQIKSTYGHPHNISNVDFLVDPEPELWVKTGLTWQQVTNLTWQVNNVVVGATLDLYFYGDPIGHNEQAKFKIYTDNHLDRCAWFTVGGYPTPVPEPATIGLLGLGALALLRKRK